MTGTTVMRLADSDVVPFDFTGLDEALGRYMSELKKLAKTEGDEINEQNKELEEGVLAATSDPTKTYVPPVSESPEPTLDFSSMDDAIANVRKSTQRYQAAFTKAQQTDASSASASFEAVNSALMRTERDLLSSEGLPGRPWYKNILYAPGIFTGYGVKTVPGVREAIEQKNWQQATEEIAIVAGALQKEADAINAAASALESAAR
jgi:N-acetylated-alpha-linked acidic dipeptidase